MPKKNASPTDERISMSVRVSKDVYEAIAIYSVVNRISHQQLLTEGLHAVMKKRQISVASPG